MSEIDTLFPGIEVNVGDEHLVVKPLAFGQLPKAIKLLRPVIASVQTSGFLDPEFAKRPIGEILEKAAGVLEAGGEELLEFLAFAVGKPRDWFDTVQMDEGARVTAAVLQANMDFFGRRVLPMLPEAQGAATQAVESGGDSSSGSSSPADTDAPTSTDTP